jgi:hypothetical protein
MSIHASGDGFKASSSIKITFDGTIEVASGTTDAQGSFGIDFKVPPLTAGSHKIRISDGTTEREFDFVIESKAPPVPELEYPITASKPKQPITFIWGAVTDESGVTYEFQLSRDATFDDPLLHMSGIVDTTITLPENQKLESVSGKTPYLWRVRAIDGAGNTSDWSTVNTFTLGFTWPSWLIHVWYSLGIIVALVFGLWFGRRMAYQSY